MAHSETIQHQLAVSVVIVVLSKCCILYFVVNVVLYNKRRLECILNTKLHNELE